MTQHSARYVLVGGGLASATAAENIRKYDKDGSILIIGSEPHPPYNRPPLSKEYLRGEAESRGRAAGSACLLVRGQPGDADDQDKGRRRGHAGQNSHAGQRRHSGLPKAADCHRLFAQYSGHFRRGRAERPSAADMGRQRRLKAHLGQKILLVGGGYIGVEVAADFLQTGGQATIIEPTDAPVEQVRLAAIRRVSEEETGSGGRKDHSGRRSDGNQADRRQNQSRPVPGRRPGAGRRRRQAQFGVCESRWVRQ